ncbi:MAG: hypothetical protein IPK22_13985 [Verrucomicrobiaceae bacterium]|nr:hypothetical protein [Verrucomicrobiaceae bacterium]
MTASFTITDTNSDPLRYDAHLTATNTPGVAKISGTTGIGTGYASISGAQQQITFSTSDVNGMLTDGAQYYVRIKAFDPSFEANSTSFHEVFVPFTFDTFTPNPLGAGVAALHNKKLRGPLCIDGTSPPPPGAQTWDWFVMRDADTNAPLAFADANGFASTVDFTRLIWRLPVTGSPAMDWSSVLPVSGTIRLRIDGYYSSASFVSSAAFTVQRQSALNATVTCPTSLFPRYRDLSFTDTFTAAASGGTPPYSYQWLLNGGGTLTPISGGVSATKILPRYGANLIFVRVSDSAGNITCSQFEAPIARPVTLGSPEARGAGGASFGGVQAGVGNFHTSSVDMHVPAIGVPFTLGKSYNSGPFAGQAGNWRFNFETYIRPTQDYQTSDIFIIDDVPFYVAFEAPDGAPTHFSLGADGQYDSFTPGDHSRLKEEYNLGGVPTYRLYTDDAEPLVYTFEGRKLDGTASAQRSNVPYRLVSIKNLRGYGLTINYLNGVQGPIAGIPRISSVTDQSGRTYSFFYDANNRINQVTANDAQLTVSYTWNSDGNVLSYRDSLSHEAGVDVRTWFSYYTSGDGAKKLSSITLPRGNTPLGSITYDGSGRVVGYSQPSATSGGVSTSWSTTFTYGSGFTHIDRPGTESDIRFFHTDYVVTGVTDSYGAGNRTTGLVPLSAAQFSGLSTSELGLPREITSPVGVKNTLGYSPDGRGLVTSIVQSASGSSTTFTKQVSYNFNPANNLALPTSVTDERNNTFTPQFSSFGELSAFLNPYSQGSRITDFDSATGLPHLVDDGRSNITELLYNGTGDTWKIIVPFDPDNANRETVFTYPTPNRGLPSTITDRKNYQTYIEWNAAGSPTLIRAVNLTPGSGETRDIVIGYDENGNRTSVTDRRQKTTNTDYDGLDRPWRVRQPSPDGVAARPTSITDFDALGRAYRSTDPNGNILEQTFGTTGNAGGLPETTRAWNPLTSSWETLQTTAYLSDGRVTSVTDGEGITHTYAYHAAPRQHLVQRISEPAPSGFQNFKEFEYDATERIIRETTGTTGSYTGHLPTKLYEYDDAGRLKRVCDVMDGDYSAAAWGKSTNIFVSTSYYGDDNIQTITDPRLETISHTYDAQGRLYQRQDALGNTWRYRYDANGNLQREIFPGGRTITRSFGVLDRLESIDYGDGLNSSVSYTYDANLNRLSMSDRRGSSSYAYDFLNRLTTYTRTPLGRSALTLAYTHEPAGQVKSITYPGSRLVSYTHDHLGRMKTISPWTGGSFIYTWRRDGKVDAISNPNGTSTDYQYNDPAGRLSRIFTQVNGTSIYHDYTWSPAGNILSITGDQPLANPTDAPVTLLPDAANRLSKINGQNLINDGAGRTEAFPAPLNAFLDFEGLDWLSSLTRAGQTTSYSYDGDGVRIARSTSAATTRYLTAPGGDMPTVMAECDDAHAPTRFHIYGATGLIATADATGGYAVPHFNHRGDTIAITRGNTAWSSSVSVGSIVESYAYSPYGLTTAANAASSYPFRFIGQHGVMDEGNGLHFMRARYYAASTGRFVSLDQLAGSAGDARTLNRFGYAGGNPITQLDPSGFDVVFSSQYLTFVPMTYKSRNYTIKVQLNGCGAKGQFTKNTIIFGSTNLVLPDYIDAMALVPACNTHDINYATLGMSKSASDKQLRRDILAILQPIVTSRYKSLTDATNRAFDLLEANVASQFELGQITKLEAEWQRLSLTSKRGWELEKLRLKRLSDLARVNKVAVSYLAALSAGGSEAYSSAQNSTKEEIRFQNRNP